MKHFLPIISLLFIYSSSAQDHGLIFQPSSNVKKYFSKSEIAYSRLAINIDILNPVIRKESQLGLMISLSRRYGMELFYGIPTGDRILQQDQFAKSMSNNKYETRFQNAKGINAFIKTGGSGLTSTIYTGLGFQRSNFETTVSSQSERTLKSQSNDIYWILGSIIPIYGNFQLNWQFGLGNRKLIYKGELSSDERLVYSGNFYGMGQIKLQYLIF